MATRSRSAHPLCVAPGFSCLLIVFLPFLLGPPPPAFSAPPVPSALAPVAMLAAGFHDLQGLAIGPDGALVAADRYGGAVYRVTPLPTGGATVALLHAGLREPRGVAVGPDGAVYVAEGKAGQVVRLDSAGPIPIWTGLQQPGFVAVAPDGTGYVTGQGRQAFPGEPKRAAGESLKAGDELFRCRPGASRCDSLLAGLQHPGGLWVEGDGSLLLSLEKRVGESERQGSTLVRVDPHLAESDAGYLTRLVGAGFTQPAGPVADVLGAALFAARHTVPWGPLGGGTVHQARAGLLVKAAPEKAPTLLGQGFGEVRALAMDSQGHLYAATDDTLFRLPAPAPPTVDPTPLFTRLTTLPLTGAAEPGAQITVRGGAAPVEALAHPETGVFSLAVGLLPNTAQTLAVHATGAGGFGLSGAAASVQATHDDQPPETMPVAGPPATISQTSAVCTAAGSDNLTPAGGLTFAWRLDQGAWVEGSPTFQFTGLTPGGHEVAVAAQDQAGNVDPTPVTWAFVVRTLQVTITHPAAGTPVSAGPLLVQGEVESGGQPVGVTVNGMPAAVAGTRWGLMVDLPPGVHQLVVTATTPDGAVVSEARQVEGVAGVAEGLSLRVYPAGGPAPLTVTFHLQNGAGVSLVRYELDADGNGTTDHDASSFDQPQATYAAPGLYLARLRATDEQGTVRTAAVLIPVLDPVQVKAQLQTTWTGLKAALREGNIPAALSFMHTRARERYELTFRSIPPEKLQEIDRILAEAVPVEIGPNGAEYEIRRLRNGEMIGFPLWFRRDADGLWRVWMF